MKKLAIVSLMLVLNIFILNAQEIKIMTWNIFMVPPFVFKSCQTERSYLIADYVKNINPDIIVFNETFMSSARSILYDKLKSNYPYQSDITKSGVLKSNSGVWIFSKFPIAKQDFVAYKKKKGSDLFAIKGARFIEVNVNNKKIQLIGTHMQSMLKFKSTRVLQYHQLKNEMADKHFDYAVPQFIVGDLNCNYYDSTECNLMHQLLDVSPSPYTGEKYSWNGMQNDLAYKFFGHDLETLDYVLLRKPSGQMANITSTKILNPYSDSCVCNKNFHNLSDHHPVISTVELK